MGTQSSPWSSAESGSVTRDDVRSRVDVSVVIPVYNERHSVGSLYAALATSLAELGRSYEIIIVDDGSTDDTFAQLAQLAATDTRVRVIQFRRNYGQTAALAAGFDHARGDVIVPMDGDLQNDPRDIEALLAKIDEGYDVVSGWRKERKDGVVRRLSSRTANRLIGLVTGVRLHDHGCTLKAYRADILEVTPLYGEMHRFLPVLASQAGARIAEVTVQHHPRRFGSSNYGLGRTFKVVLDLLTVKFLTAWQTKPSYLFGGSGAVLCLAGVVFVLWTAYQRILNGIYVHRQPSLLVGVFLFTIGFNLILLGLLAELVVRTHRESQSKPVYAIRERLNFQEHAPLD